jgi:hypothetical protein
VCEHSTILVLCSQHLFLIEPHKLYLYCESLIWSDWWIGTEPVWIYVQLHWVNIESSIIQLICDKYKIMAKQSKHHRYFSLIFSSTLCFEFFTDGEQNWRVWMSGCIKMIREKYNLPAPFFGVGGHHWMNDPSLCFVSTVSTCLRCKELTLVVTRLSNVQASLIGCFSATVVHSTLCIVYIMIKVGCIEQLQQHGYAVSL